ncbi:MAG: hypothetical protein JSV71_00870 [Nitrospiraceae bacterium]|nr:MAG: hypothetical protein JSV71_00870 [Nitrospiraceae bacterium]
MNRTIEMVIIEPIKDFANNILDFLPNLLAALLVFFIGIAIAVLLKKTFVRIFKAIGLDKISEKVGIMEVLKKGGIKDSLSTLLAKIISWLTILIFLIISLRALNIPTIERMMEEFFLYLPNVFVAILILSAGYFLSNFLGRTVLIASVNAGFKLSGIIGKFVQFTVFFISVAMALEQLGIGKETVLLTFAILYGGVVFALALAFGIGGKEVAREYLEKRLKGEGDDDDDDIQHL